MTVAVDRLLTVALAVVLVIGCAPAGAHPRAAPNARDAYERAPEPTDPPAAGWTRVAGTVTDADTGRAVVSVCVYLGPPTGCPQPHHETDQAGRYVLDVPAGRDLLIQFERPGYEPIRDFEIRTLRLSQLRDLHMRRR